MAELVKTREKCRLLTIDICELELEIQNLQISKDFLQTQLLLEAETQPQENNQNSHENDTSDQQQQNLDLQKEIITAFEVRFTPSEEEQLKSILETEM